MADPIGSTALPTKVTGAVPSTGADTSFVNASTNGDFYTRDVINNGMQNQAISVSTSAVEAKCTVKLVNRKFLSITPTNGTIYWGATGVTTSSGTPIVANTTLFLSFSDATAAAVFLIAAGTVDVRIVEGS